MFPFQQQPSDRDRDGFFVLRRTYSELFKKYSYLIKDDFVQNRIIEYDLRSANTSALRRIHAIRDDDLDMLESLPKKEREKAIGQMIKVNPRIDKVIKKQIVRAKRELFETNSVQDDEVLAIKNDAVYIMGRKLKTTTFGPMEFRAKNSYALYINMNRLEFYYDRANSRIHVSGINDDVLANEDHINGMEQFFVEAMEYLTMDRRDALRRYLIKFVDDYKSMRLPLCYYREMNGDNIYRTTYSVSGYSLNLDQVAETDRSIINGVYNYKRFVLPFVQRFL